MGAATDIDVSQTRNWRSLSTSELMGTKGSTTDSSCAYDRKINRAIKADFASNDIVLS